MRIDLNEMRRRLNRPIPGLYREFIESSSSNLYEGTLADPAELPVWQRYSESFAASSACDREAVRRARICAQQ